MKKENRGGARKGAGPKKLPDGHKKEQITLTIYLKGYEKEKLKKIAEFKKIKDSNTQRFKQETENLLKNI